LNYSAHTLKGCVSNFGAQRLYDAAFVMEQMGRRSDLSNVETAFKLLEAEMHRLEGDLRELTAEQ
jgi:HPt (histidine-containing phosphotransfer) domain-containing protein